MPELRISPVRRAGKVIIRFLSALLTILFVLVVAICTAIWVLVKGPSPTAQRLFVMSVRETSAVGWLANIFLSEAEIDKIIGATEPYTEFHETDTSLITLPAARPARSEAAALEDAAEGILPSDKETTDADTDTAAAIDAGAAANGDTDAGASADAGANADASIDADQEADLDGIELHEVSGAGYVGYMLVVRDPLRVFVGTPDYLGGSGVRLMDMMNRTGAIAGINAGGFYDPDGTSSGGIPDGLVICDGTLKWGAGSGYVNVIGFDADGILHVGTMTPSAAMDLGLQWAVSFGPTLISNGVAQDKESVRSGINPRTAIGQRSDGAVLLLVVDGRQIHSLGATYEDLIEIFLDFGAVNAANLDGGSSTLMILEGDIINSCASVAGPRTIPTAFLVR